MAENEDYLYHARELQVIAIKNETAELLRREMLVCVRDRSSEALSVLLRTAPIELPIAIKGFVDSEKTLRQLAYFATIATSKRDFVLETFDRLMKACSLNSRGLKEVSMDDQDAYWISPDFQFVFRNDTEDLLDAIEESHFQGTKVLLDAVQVQNGIPLMRYRRDAIKAITDLSPSFDGGEIGYLGTKVSSINLKLWYPKNANFPKLSFLVEDII